MRQLQKMCFLTAVVTVVNRGVLFSSLVGIWLVDFVSLFPVFCGKIYPLQVCYRPNDHLTFCWLVSQQVKWRFRRKEYSTGFASVCFTAKIDLCVVIIFTTRENPALTVCISWVAIIPVDTSFCQTLRAAPPFVNTVLTCRGYKRLSIVRWLLFVLIML